MRVEGRFYRSATISSAVNSLWHEKITWFIPMLFEYLCKSSAQGGLVWMLWSGLVFWLWWGQVWRLWWDVVGVGEEIGVGKETSLPDNHVLCHVSGLPLWFYWIFSISAVSCFPVKLTITFWLPHLRDKERESFILRQHGTSVGYLLYNR